MTCSVLILMLKAKSVNFNLLETPNIHLLIIKCQYLCVASSITKIFSYYFIFIPIEIEKNIKNKLPLYMIRELMIFSAWCQNCGLYEWNKNVGGIWVTLPKVKELSSAKKVEPKYTKPTIVVRSTDFIRYSTHRVVLR